MGLDTAVARIAAVQHGVFNRTQATGAGATPAQIDRRTASGLWVVLDRSTYALASSPATWHRTVMAAVLSKTRAFASGVAAGSLHGLPGCPQRRPEITVPFTGNARSPLASVRRRSDFTAIGRAEVSGIPVSSVSETIFDLARTMRRYRLQRAIDHALVHDLVTVEALQAVLQRTEGMRLKGTVVFREALVELTDGYVPTESSLEQILFSVIDVPDIPTPDRQVRLAWWDRLPHRVDGLIAPWRLILEADGRRFHTKREDFERDRARDNLAASHGYRVMRFTYEMLTNNPDQVVQLVLEAGRKASFVSGAGV